jgi:hypothetical protein
MNDFAAAMAPKSDQINAQDLIAGDMTVTIAAVKVTPGTEQPVSIRLDGTEKVWRPCKTTGRILMAAWGADTSVYGGRAVQLYLDPDVKWGGMKVGGIRIRAMSHLDGDLRIALAESKQNRKLFTIKPLAGNFAKPAPKDRPATQDATESPAISAAKAAAAKGVAAFRAWFNTDEGKDCRASGALTDAVLFDCRVIASGADELLARMAANPLPMDADPMTDPDQQSQIDREHAAFLADRDREAAGA